MNAVSPNTFVPDSAEPSAFVNVIVNGNFWTVDESTTFFVTVRLPVFARATEVFVIVAVIEPFSILIGFVAVLEPVYPSIRSSHT